MNVAQVDLISGPGCKHFNPLPLFHAGGLNTVSLPMLITGGCVSVAQRFDPDQCLGALADAGRGMTHFAGVPTMYQMMTELPAFAKADLSRLRHAQVAGGFPHPDLASVLADKGVVLQTHYGGTEMGPAIAAMPIEHAARKPGSCGLPVPHTQIRLVGRDGADVEVGEVGEAWIEGPSVTPGYWRRDPSQDPSFEGEWFCTGDACRQDDEGFLYIIDRFKDMYKSGGENVFPAEVERVLTDHPAIAEVAVIGIEDAKWGEVGRALIGLRPGTTLTLEAVVSHCEGRLAHYKIPKSMVVVDHLPRNSTGKVVKADLRAQHGQ
jgi:fatty-acyl-CoA synthase